MTAHREISGFTFVAEDVYEFSDRIEMLPVYRFDTFWDGAERRDPTNEFVLLPAGTYRSGFSFQDVTEWRDYFDDTFRFEPNEVWHDVPSMLFARTSLTQANLDRFVDRDRFVDQRTTEGPSIPVHGIGFLTAQQIALEAGLDIPTGPEWEFAARGGSESVFSFGPVDFFAHESAWYNMISPMGVAQKQPNGFGLFDTAGNVWEWCTDTRVEPRFNTKLRDLRGGAWNCENPIALMTSFSIASGENYTGPDVGVRLCKRLD